MNIKHLIKGRPVLLPWWSQEMPAKIDSGLTPWDDAVHSHGRTSQAMPELPRPKLSIGDCREAAARATAHQEAGMVGP